MLQKISDKVVGNFLIPLYRIANKGYTNWLKEIQPMTL
jgi:hypothetical protein